MSSEIMGQLDARRIDAYMQDGELLRQQVEKASRLVIQATMAKL